MNKQNLSIKGFLFNQAQCHKQVHYLPMNWEDYNKFRGWQVPDDENPRDEGYLVVYAKGTEDEYISWSPKDVFNSGYAPIGEIQNSADFAHIEKMVSELEYTFERIGDSTTTVCYAFLPNGFRVGHGDSACVDPDNFDWVKGCKHAKERAKANAIDELWKLEGYLLKCTGRTSK